MRRRPVRAFLIGAIVGAILMSIADTQAGSRIPIPFYWLLVPGLLLTTPVLLLTGGAHGPLAGTMFAIVPLANGLFYALVDRWIQRRRSR